MTSSPENGIDARLVIAAPQGRSGKTTVSLGLCAALTTRGLAVQPFKKGPDYIDPSWLTEGTGFQCRTLDPFFLDSPEKIRFAYLRGSQKADLSLIEGNHGLYDSLDEEGSTSTAAVARCLKAPVILVINTARMSRSAAAMVKGYQSFEPDTNIAGVILNNVARSRHEQKLRQAIERYCRIPVLGAIPRDQNLTIPDRHLGLIPRAEDEELIPALAACRRAAAQHVDLEAVLAIAQSAPPFSAAELEALAECGCGAEPVPGQPTVRIGVIRDRAFTFYYPANLEALVDAGANLVFIDAFRTASLPYVDALYIGGGFPEIFMEELAANRGLRQDIRSAAEAGLPIYAECGGLMYLARRIIWGEQTAPMVGALPCDVELTDQPQGHGYVIAEAASGHPFLEPGATIRGHEFHNSRLVNWTDERPTVYQLKRGHGLGNGRDGLVHHNILAAYTHLHATGSPGWAEGLVKQALAYKKEVTYAPL